MKIAIVIGLGLVTSAGCNAKKVGPAGESAGSASGAPTTGSATGSGGVTGTPTATGSTGPATRKVVKIGAGDGAACAVMDNGTVRCWGKNDAGERGTAPSSDDAATPTEVPGVAGAVDIVMGGDGGASGDVACVLTKDTSVWCWGARAMIPNNKTANEPREIPELKGALSIALGGGTGYAVKPDGTVWGWGSPAFNALADGTTSGGSDKPLTQIPDLAGAKQVVAGQNHGCALLGDGSVTCWGYVGKTQLPTKIDKIAGATWLYAESQRDNTCAKTADGVLCWGSSQAPELKPEFKDATKLAGRNHECMILADGGARCVGDTDFGMLGTDKRGGNVEGLSKKVVDIAVGHVFGCAALEDGSAACWGFNQRGQLGDGTLMDRHAATPVVGLQLDHLAAAANGQDHMQEGPDATKWDGMPAQCKNGPIELVSKHYEGKTFTVKAARGTSQLDGKTIKFELADHNFQESWGGPRGTQAKLSFRLANVKREGEGDNAKLTPIAVDVGEYKLGMGEDRLVSPTLTTKTGTQSLFSISLTKGIDAGTLTVSFLDDKWICGELAIAADQTTVKGPFAAPLTK